MPAPSELAFRCDKVQVLAYTALSSSYAQFTNPIAHVWRFIDMVNSTNADCYVSFDGTDDNLYMPAGSFRIYDLSINSMVMSLGTVVWVRTTGSPSSGQVTVTGGYQQGT